MDAVIDLGLELLIDESRIQDPYLRLLAAAIGEKIVPRSPWRAINKAMAESYGASEESIFHNYIGWKCVRTGA
jgi:hypothetical protein